MIILQRNGYAFASEGCEYTIRLHGVLVMANMNKRVVEELFFKLCNNS